MSTMEMLQMVLQFIPKPTLTFLLLEMDHQLRSTLQEPYHLFREISIRSVLRLPLKTSDLRLEASTLVVMRGKTDPLYQQQISTLRLQ